MNFWNNLSRPFTILAPMEGVTDVVFREIIAEIGRPDVFFTEFTNCDGIMSEGREKVEQSLKFTKKQSPVVAQIWGKNPKTFYETAKYCRSLGFDGIDINMGCPDRVIVNRGSCAALIRNPNLAKEIVDATKEGAGDLPVSVKTRLGFEKSQVDEWISFLLEQRLPALSIHLRTVSELSKVPAHWELMSQIIELKNKISPKTLIVGNGDLLSLEEVSEKFKNYHCDGFMIGRGIFHNPWLFNSKIKIEEMTSSDRLNLYIKHIKLFGKTWKDKKNDATLKKFGKTYINNFSDASHLRESVMRAKDISQMIEIIEKYKIRKNLG